MIDCKFRIDKKCGLAKRLLLNIEIDDDIDCKDDAFNACTNHKCPHTYNSVVGSLTLAYLTDKNIKNTPIHPDLRDLIRSGKQCLKDGPGTELKKLLAYVKIVPDKDDYCGCEWHAHQMNLWGPDNCRKNIKTIIHWMQVSSNRRKWKWEWNENIMATLVLLACQLAEGTSWTVVITKLPFTIVSTAKILS